jgi:osmotically-inducible protein OsmY
MKTANPPRGDIALKDSILQELKWEPSVNEAHIGVIVEDGVVTLTGNVPNWPQRAIAERAVRRVAGVAAIANDLEVKLPGDTEKTDAEIAREAINALDWNVAVPRKAVQVSVHHGWITLRGDVEWNYQRASAERSVRDLRGVRGTINEIAVRPTLAASDVRSKIVAALERSAIVESKGITVATHDRTVTLDGRVRSWTERDEVERAAWAAPGVTKVENHLKVVYA